jgi:hypothetical protein
MVRKIVIGTAAGLAAGIAAFALVVATRPATFHIERSVTVAAPPENAFAMVNDFHNWAGWSPYEKLDPNMKRTFAGAPSGTGAIYGWSGNKEVGEGRMTIEKSDRPSQVLIKLEFIKPFTATNAATFTFAAIPEGTKVTWAMDGNNSFVAKALHMFMDMDKMVGADFERGLAAIKSTVEGSSKVNAEATRAVE